MLVTTTGLAATTGLAWEVPVAQAVKRSSASGPEGRTLDLDRLLDVRKRVSSLPPVTD